MRVERLKSQERLQLARSSAWGKGLSPACLHALSQMATVVRYHSGERMELKGTTSGGLLLVLSGSLQEDGRGESLVVTDPKGLLCQSVLAHNRNAGLDGAVVLYVPRSAFLDLVDLFPEWSVMLAEFAP